MIGDVLERSEAWFLGPRPMLVGYVSAVDADAEGWPRVVHAGRVVYDATGRCHGRLPSSFRKVRRPRTRKRPLPRR